MDMSSLLNVLTSADAVNNLGKATKTDASTVQNVLSAALPSLLDGAQKQSQGKDTVDGFAEALMSHGKNDASDLGAFMGKVDMEDGAKIVSHLLGKNSAKEVESISRAAGATTKQTNSILSAAAPLLMALLGKQLLQNMLGGNNNNNSGNANPLGGALGAGVAGALAGSLLGNMDMGGLLGGLLGGGNQSSNNQTIPLTNNNNNNNNNNSNGGGLLGGLLNLLK